MADEGTKLGEQVSAQDLGGVVVAVDVVTGEPEGEALGEDGALDLGIVAGEDRSDALGDGDDLVR